MNIDKIKEQKWYRQETEGTPYFIYGPCRSCIDNFKSKSQIIWYCDPERAQAFLSEDLLRKKAEECLRHGKKTPEYFLSLFDNWDKKIRKKAEGIFIEIKATDLKTTSDQHLLELNNKLAQHAYDMWLEFYIDIFDLDAEGLVEAELVEEGITLDDDERNTMMTQIKPLVHQCAEKDLLKIVKLIRETPGAVNTLSYISTPANLHRLTTYPKIDQALQEYQQNFFWINNSWGVTKVLTAFDFVDSIKQVLAGSRNITAEIKAIEDFDIEIKRKKSEIADKHQFSKWLRSMFDFFGVLTYWRDERKKIMQRMNHYLEVLGREIAQRSGMTWEEIRVCDSLEIDAIPVSKKLVRQQFKLYSERSVLIWNGKKCTHLSKQKGEAVLQAIEETINTDVSEFRGMIACPGKVTGRVVVIQGKNEFDKMKEGDILVTTMTRPEFVPLMKKAAAIITDEGGITSHAAVVSRELKVPCIIGTQIATKKLSDGDEVFVNADHGVVMIK